MSDFEKATRKKLRFQTEHGQISTEDLWDLPLQALDELAKRVNRQFKAEAEESFIPTKAKKVSDSGVKLEILKRIIEVKVGDQDRSRARTERRAQINRLKELAVRKQDDQLSAMPIDEINSMLAKMMAEEDDQES